ncbi:MAG: DUF3238 domain-containing protein [Gammaproteobacteria bacterium]|nr:DUF3238 domain-containing protein [Gammaproteobacteria bacterium]
MVFSGSLNVYAADTYTVVIKTVIRDVVGAPLPGEKSEQTIHIDFDSKTVTSEFTTGTTDVELTDHDDLLAGRKGPTIKVESIRDKFIVRDVVFYDKQDYVFFVAQGETASGMHVTPNINYSFSIAVVPNHSELPGINNQVRFHGFHDGYPSYEIYVNDTKVYDFQQGLVVELVGDSDVRVPMTAKSF